MFEYLANNKEWIFSGVGIAAITFIFTILRQMNTFSFLGFGSSGAIARDLEEMTAEDIVKWFKHVKDPIEKKRIAKQMYYEKPVKWKGEIKEITISGDCVFIELPFIHARMKINNAGVLRKGKVVLVSGTISEIEDVLSYVNIKDAEFSDH